MYSGRKTTESLGNVTVRGEKRWKEQGGARWPTVCMYSITENIYYLQLSSVAILQQPEPNCFTSCNTMKGLCSLSLCAIVLRSSPDSHVSTFNSQRSSPLFCVHYSLVVVVRRFRGAYCLHHQGDAVWNSVGTTPSRPVRHWLQLASLIALPATTRSAFLASVN
jgi:hypothetical protein